MGLRPTQGDEKRGRRPLRNRDRKEAHAAREHTRSRFSTECPWPCGPPRVMKNFDRNRAVTGRERKQPVVFSTCSSGELPDSQPQNSSTSSCNCCFKPGSNAASKPRRAYLQASSP